MQCWPPTALYSTYINRRGVQMPRRRWRRHCWDCFGCSSCCRLTCHAAAAAAAARCRNTPGLPCIGVACPPCLLTSLRVRTGRLLKVNHHHHHHHHHHHRHHHHHHHDPVAKQPNVVIAAAAPAVQSAKTTLCRGRLHVHMDVSRQVSRLAEQRKTCSYPIGRVRCTSVQRAKWVQH